MGSNGCFKAFPPVLYATVSVVNFAHPEITLFCQWHVTDAKGKTSTKQEKMRLTLSREALFFFLFFFCKREILTVQNPFFSAWNGNSWH